MTVDRLGPVPVYRQIADQLRGEIMSGHFSPGVGLPSERKLMERFGVTRATVRHALAELRNEGLVIMERGAGAFVRASPPVRRVIGPQRFSRRDRQEGRAAYSVEMESAGISHRTEVYDVVREKAEGEVAERLGVASETAVIRRYRRYWANDWPMQLGTSYIPYDLAKGTPIADVDSGPGGIYARLEEAGHTIGMFQEEITARMPTPDERSQLRIPEGVPVLRVVRTAEEKGSSRVLELFVGVMPADRYVLVYPFPAE